MKAILGASCIADADVGKQDLNTTAERRPLATLTGVPDAAERRQDSLQYCGGALRLRSFRDGDAYVVALAGEFEPARLMEVERELERAEGGDARVIVLDLRELEFVASIDLEIVTMAQIRAPSRLVVVHGSQRAQHAFDVGHLSALRAARGTGATPERRSADEQPGEAPVERGAEPAQQASSGMFRSLRSRWRTSATVFPRPSHRGRAT